MGPLLEELYSQKPTGTLYHYTTAATLKKIVDGGVLHATQIQYMNDSKEYSRAVDIGLFLLEEREKKKGYTLANDVFKRGLEGINLRTRTFIASLSEEGDKLGQWRGYCRDGGVSIGFEHEKIQRVASKNNFRLIRCEYDESKQLAILDELLNKLLPIAEKTTTKEDILGQFHGVFGGIFHEIAPCFKHPSFEEEHEWRLIAAPSKGNKLMDKLDWKEANDLLTPFLPVDLYIDEKIPLKEVYVAPTVNFTLSYESLGSYFNSHKVASTLESTPEIKPSRSPFRG